MTPKKTTPFVLLMFTVMCTLPAAAGAIQAAIAQEDDITSLDEENLAGDIASNVLGGSGDADEEENDGDAAGDDTNTQVAVPVTDQDQGAANLALNEALDVTVERTLSTTPPPDDDELPPEDEDVFCLVDIDFGILCFNTLEDCEIVEDLFGRFIVTGCEEFETPPSDARICRFVAPLSVDCEPPL
jgi:hypothetical protein